MLKKSAEAMLAAVEIYNKPKFNYREESFSILAINAWELLIKARLLHLSSNKLSSLYVYEYLKNKDGTRSKKRSIVRNRSRAPKTLGLMPAYSKIIKDYGENPNPNVIKNLVGLIEVRDNSVHFFQKGFDLRKRVHELGSANIKNYLTLAKEWFGEDLTDFEFFLMPLGFINTNNRIVTGVHTSKEEKLGIDYFNQLSSENEGSESKAYSVMLDIKVGLSKDTSSPNFELVKFTNDPNAKPVRITEADFKQRYPWSYRNLTAHLKRTVEGFKINKEYHKIRQTFESNPSLCKIRYLDPDNPNSQEQKWYNPDIAIKIKFALLEP